jgi:signal transduction histidine kinase
MEKLSGIKLVDLRGYEYSTKLLICITAVMLFLIIISLLLTRQILTFDNVFQTVVFLLVVGVGYGLASWVLLKYIKQTSNALRTKSLFIKRLHLSVSIVQFSLLGILLYLIYDNTTNCYDFFNFCTHSRLEATSVNALASLASSIVLGLFSYQFFSWYKITNKSNIMLLFFGLAAASLGMSIGVDALDKIVIQKVIEEKSDNNSIPNSSFIYKTSKKYDGQVQYKIINHESTTLYVVPNSMLSLHKIITYLVSDTPYIFTWLSIFILLRQYYQRIGQKISKFPVKYWILLSVPLVLYIVGSGLIISLPNDATYRMYMRIVFRAGTIGSSLLFGLAFFIITRNISSKKVKDYLLIAAIGLSTVGIANEVSGLQQTYGVGAHSLVLLSSYMFCIGLYASAIFLSQDANLRNFIRKSALDESKTLVNVGAAQLKQQLERKVLSTAVMQEELLTEKSGVKASLTNQEMRQYLSNVLKEIKVVHDYDQIISEGREILDNSNEFLACLKSSSARSAYNNYFDSYKRVMSRFKSGEHKGIRMVTNVDNDSIDVFKEFLGLGVQIRHVKNLPPIDFAVSDKAMIANLHQVEANHKVDAVARNDPKHRDLLHNLLVSNEPAYIDHFISIFKELWSSGIDANDRINSIEHGIEPDFLEVITDAEKVSRVLVDLVNSVKREALLLLPNDKAMIRIDKLGIIDNLIELSKRGVVVKIICPMSEINSSHVTRMTKTAPNIRVLDGHNSSAGMLIADGSRFLRVEAIRPDADNCSESVGFSLYSNSKPGVDSFKSIFELLWSEHLVNEELKKAHEMQSEFINIAAHELRTPIQPILGLSSMIGSQGIDSKKQQEIIDIVIRNAKRLQKLSENILDITRIEAGTLEFKKEQVNLNELIYDAIEDFQSQIRKYNKDLKIKCVLPREDILVDGDRIRLAQVVANLLNNALKFTDKGTVSLLVQNNQNDAIVSISDTGRGIDPEIMSKLFTKFTSKSASGVGLGLYISKGIVEAHGGSIWGKNNQNQKGATFCFSIPLQKSPIEEIGSNTTTNEGIP